MMKRILIRGLAAVLMIGMVGCAADKKALKTQPVKKAAFQGKWSEPVNGLRARIVSEKAKYVAGEEIHLRLEFQNVSKERKAFEEPGIHPMIYRPDAYPEHPETNTMITAEAVEPAIPYIVMHRRILISGGRCCRPFMLPNQVFVAPIVAFTCIEKLRATLRGQQQQLAEAQKGDPIILHKRRVQWEHGDRPGRYRLKATYIWGKNYRKGRLVSVVGKIVMPCIEIEIEKKPCADAPPKGQASAAKRATDHRLPATALLL